MTSSSDADLIVAARAGDEIAYGLLYQRHSAAAYRLARHIVKDPADVDDVVAETFVRVLYAMKNGNGPAEAFRPYLLTAIRRVAFYVLNGQRRQIPTDEADLPDPGAPFIDPMVADLERSLITQAFRSLPERWSAVLWYLDVEEAKPADVAAMLGLSANGVAVLKRRAREGLKEAYLQLHVSDTASANCAPTVGKLSRYVRGRLSKRQVKDVEEHLASCANCTRACADLTAINDTLGGVLAPVVLGAAAAGYLAAGPAPIPAATPTVTPASAPAAHLVHAQVGLRSARLASRRVAELITHHPIASVATAAAAASIAVPSVYFLHPPRGHAEAIAVPGITRRHEPAPTSGPSPSGQPNRSATPGASAPITASPKPSRSSSRSPKPTPSTTGPGSPSPTSSASPSASPTPTVTAKAKLGVSVQVNGLLNLGVTALVTINVSDPGSAATGPVTANITLPSGITLLGLSGSSSWSCSATGSGQTCSRASLGAGVASSLSFNVLVANLTGCGNSVLATATSDGLSATGASSTTVQCGLLNRVDVWERH